ncbi:MAG: hypothetical protein HC907_05575 [Richelia sp. SM1_7_0]|nr:hypothetical protein [Richelia sp. SM1_7_0]
MTRFIHDQFAKDYLVRVASRREELLKDYGEVKPSEKFMIQTHHQAS